MRIRPAAQVAMVCIGLFGGASAIAAAQLFITDERVHLGTPGFPEWEHFAGKTPQGRQLDLRFQARANAGEATLFVRQDDVKYAWSVKLNGKTVGRLANMEVKLVTPFRVPAGVLKDGENLLSIVPPKNTDDILVGEIVLDSRPFEAAVNEASVAIEVKLKTLKGEVAVPCRITIADDDGALAPVYTDPDETLPTGKGVLPTKPGQRLAVRTGVVYTPDGKARIGLRPGKYTIYASRGFEYSVATNHVTVAVGDKLDLSMSLAREVNTEGWVAADCHIHNLTYSGHGDATIDEGMVTIAGEGIEFAVATDHNHHTDYTETLKKLKLSDRFTSVVGNEVTTKTGHFNAFPILPGSSLPDSKLGDWTELMKSIRGRTGAKVIVLNHPRNVHSGFTPVDPEHFRQVTGQNLRDGDYSFDAMEIVTSAALQSDLMDPIRDWFGMLNYGYRITGVGASDTHYVSRMILGQGRSYVKADDSDPANLNVDEIVRSYREGRVAVSMGLLVDIEVNGKYGMGELVADWNTDSRIAINLRSPGWIRPRKVDGIRLAVYVNGRKDPSENAFPTLNGLDLQDFPGVPKLSEPLDHGPFEVSFSARWAKSYESGNQDFWIVAVATGPGVTAPFWAIPRPYQPSSKKWTPRVVGVTNPVYVDADGDGKYTSPRGYAKQLVARHGDDVGSLIRALREYDQAIAAQAASLLHERGIDLDSKRIKEALESGREATREGFAAFAKTLQ
jgi:hypothetical protein